MEHNKSSVVEVVAVTLGIFMVITIMFLIFAKSDLGILVPISGAFMVLGIVASIFQYKLLAGQKDKKK
jgi:hypothetical protein